MSPLSLQILNYKYLDHRNIMIIGGQVLSHEIQEKQENKISRGYLENSLNVVSEKEKQNPTYEIITFV